MSIAAVLTNCALIAFASAQLERWFPAITPAAKAHAILVHYSFIGQIVAIFAFEHVLFGCQALLRGFQPRTPSG